MNRTLSMLALASLLACSCSPRTERTEGTEPGDCEDGADNDGDRVFDCADDSCAGSPICSGLDGGTPDAGSRDAGERRDARAPEDARAPQDARPPEDARTPSDGGLPPGLPAVTAGATGAPADYACAGTAAAPAAGASASMSVEVRDLVDDFAVDGVTVWVFRDDSIVDACVAPSCQSVVTNASGTATVTLPAGGWFAYRILPRAGATRMTTAVGTLQRHIVARDLARLTSVSGTAVDLIPALYGISRVEGTALVLGGVRDCDDELVQGAIVRIYDADGVLLVEGGPSDTHYGYLNGSGLPDSSQRYTNTDGAFMVVNLPVGDTRPVRVEAWGRRSGGGPGELLGCETTRLVGDQASIVDLGPLRADGPCP